MLLLLRRHLLLRVNAWNAASKSRIAARAIVTTVSITATAVRWSKAFVIVAMPKAAGITSAMTVPVG